MNCYARGTHQGALIRPCAVGQAHPIEPAIFSLHVRQIVVVMVHLSGVALS